MKVIVLCTGIILLATTALSQGTHQLDIYFNTGLCWPASPVQFTGPWRMGYNFGAGIGYGVAPNISIVGCLDYYRFLDAKGIPGEDRGDRQFLSISGKVKMTLLTQSTGSSVYAIAGAGYSREWVPDSTYSAFPIYVGVGLDIPAGKAVTAFVEGKYGMYIEKGYNPVSFALKLGARWTID